MARPGGEGGQPPLALDDPASYDLAGLALN
jgi:hypothetical protein